MIVANRKHGNLNRSVHRRFVHCISSTSERYMNRCDICCDNNHPELNINAHRWNQGFKYECYCREITSTFWIMDASALSHFLLFMCTCHEKKKILKSIYEQQHGNDISCPNLQQLNNWGIIIKYNIIIINKTKHSRLSGWMRRSLQQAVNWVLAASSAPAGPAQPLPSSAGWDYCGHLSLTEFSGARVDEDTCSFLLSTDPAFRNERKERVIWISAKLRRRLICSLILWDVSFIRRSGAKQLWKYDDLFFIMS